MALKDANTRCNFILNVDGLSDEAKEALYQECLLDSRNNIEDFDWGGNDNADLKLEAFENNDFFRPASKPKFTLTPRQIRVGFTKESLYKSYLLRAISWFNLFTQYYIPKQFTNWGLLPEYEKRMTQKIIFSIIDFWSVNINPIEPRSSVSYNNPYGYNIDVSHPLQSDWTAIIGTEATHMILSTGWNKTLFFVNKERKVSGKMSDVWITLNLLYLRQQKLEASFEKFTEEAQKSINLINEFDKEVFKDIKIIKNNQILLVDYEATTGRSELSLVKDTENKKYVNYFFKDEGTLREEGEPESWINQVIDMRSKYFLNLCDSFQYKLKKEKPKKYERAKTYLDLRIDLISDMTMFGTTDIFYDNEYKLNRRGEGAYGWLKGKNPIVGEAIFSKEYGQSKLIPQDDNNVKIIFVNDNYVFDSSLPTAKIHAEFIMQFKGFE